MTALKILVPVDFSSGSKVSLAYAAALATSLQATVTLFHVYQMPDLMNSIVPGADNTADAEEDRRLAKKWLESLRAEIQKERDVEISVVVEHGSPAGEIVSFSRNGGFEMIVMGTHGRTGLRHLLMGSVAEGVVRRASCPVMTIHLPFPDGTGDENSDRARGSHLLQRPTE
jgi:nucleotide-binding universal stress UspA family protein